jgi:hypothetical protein
MVIKWTTDRTSLLPAKSSRGFLWRFAQHATLDGVDVAHDPLRNAAAVLVGLLSNVFALIESSSSKDGDSTYLWDSLRAAKTRYSARKTWGVAVKRLHEEALGYVGLLASR